MDEAKQKFCLTSLERAWILYDVGNSAFVLLVATLIPIFFNALAEGGGLSSVEYLAYWGYAASAVTVITAVVFSATLAVALLVIVGVLSFTGVTVTAMAWVLVRLPSLT